MFACVLLLTGFKVLTFCFCISLGFGISRYYGVSSCYGVVDFTAAPVAPKIWGGADFQVPIYGTDFQVPTCGADMIFRCHYTELNFRCKYTELIFRCQYVEPVGDEARKFPKALSWAALRQYSSQHGLEESCLNHSIVVTILQHCTFYIQVLMTPRFKKIPSGKWILRCTFKKDILVATNNSNLR